MTYNIKIKFTLIAGLLLMATGIMAQSTDYSKLSSWVRQIVYGQDKANGKTNDPNKTARNNQKDKEKQLCAFMKISGNADKLLKENGCKQLARLGDVYIVNIPLSSLPQLSRNSQVERIEARQSNSVLLDTTAILTDAKHVYNALHLPQAFTGKGVVVGIQDVGFDLTHPTFYNRDLSEYRIKTLWDQLSTDTIGSQMYVGQTYDGKESLLEYAHSRDNLLISHGTHTSSTAAGSGYDSNYRGIAFESDICLVNNAVTTDLPLIDSADVYKYTYATDVLGFKYMFDYADSVGKPCVVSFSEGSHQDLRGDDILYYEALNALLKPGHIIVASAGNEGTQTSMVPKPAGKTSAGTYLLSNNKRIVITAETTSDITFRLLIYNNREKPDTLEVCTSAVTAMEDSIYNDTISTQGGDYNIEIHGFQSCYEPEKNAFDILINAPEAAGIKTSLWFEMEGKEAESRMFIASGYFYNTKMNIRTGDAVKGYNIHSPGSAPGVICVGATSFRHSYYNYLGNYFESSAFIDGHRAHYSSIGPTIDGRIKPDVVAPGTNVIAAYSSYYLEANPDASDIESDVSHFDFNGRTYAWNANTGTSMSTPVVAGIIALWLEACPTLTTAEVIEIFKNTCIHPEPSMTYPNNEYGYGAINAYRGLLYILGLDPSLGIETISANQPEKIKFSLEDRLLKIHFDESAECSGLLHIYTISGQKVKSLPISKDCQQIDLSNLKTGIYAVQISTNNKSTTGSTLIRLQ